MKKGVKLFIRETWEGVKFCWLPLQALLFFTVFPVEMLIVVTHGLMSGPTADFTYVAVFTITAFLTGLDFYITALFIAAFYVLLGKEVKVCNFKKALEAGQSAFAKMIIVLVICLLVLLGGILFLVLPGIYFAVTMMYVPIVVVLEKRAVRDAFVRSYDLVRGRWWKTFGRLWPIFAGWFGLLLLFLIVPDIVYLKGIFFALVVDVLLVFSMAYVYRLYVDAKATE